MHVDTRDERDAWVLLCARSDTAQSFTDCASFEGDRLDADFERDGFEVIPSVRAVSR
jgi:hypothetical protein